MQRGDIMAKTKNIKDYQVKQSNGKIANVIIWILLSIWTLVNLYPLYWMVLFSLKNDTEVYSNKFGLPKEWAWQNYQTAMRVGNIGRNYLNSIIVAFATILITLVAASMATYALTRIRWRGAGLMHKIFLLGITIPVQSSIVPIFVVLNKLKLRESYFAMILPYSAFALAMGILICAGFMTEIPKELDEAAYIDGCGRARVFFKVIVPLMKPAVATVSIYTFMQCWNELIFATIFIDKSYLFTIPVGIQQLVGTFTTSWGSVGAALTIATVPTVIAYILLSRRIQESFIAGAIKG